VFFNMAAQDTYTFYGMLANERLGREDLLRWRAPRLDPVALEELLADKGVQRTLALAQIGEYGLAQAELRASYERIPYQYDETLLALALKLNLANTAMTLARNLQEQEKTYLLGLYPLIEQWVPSGHVRVDPALLHAIIRQESAFDPGVVSSAGARGLMQLMPNTATYIARMNGKNPYPRYRLYEPSANTELGQDYLIYLQQKMGSNLLAMISSYNAGPGNVGKWLADERVGAEDPLLFIESIPFSETRNYLKKVLTNYWLYRRQFGAPTPTLKSLSHNQWPEAFLEPIEYEVSQEIKRLAPSVSRPTVFTGGKKPLTEERSEPLKTLPAAPVPEQSNDPDYEDILQPPSL
jgi:soluble lytic murein transglycosylase-like protein